MWQWSEHICKHHATESLLIGMKYYTQAWCEVSKP